MSTSPAAAAPDSDSRLKRIRTYQQMSAEQRLEVRTGNIARMSKEYVVRTYAEACAKLAKEEAILRACREFGMPEYNDATFHWRDPMFKARDIIQCPPLSDAERVSRVEEARKEVAFWQDHITNFEQRKQEARVKLGMSPNHA